jgi:hypothetical protein
VLLREHAAPRRAEQVDALEPELVADGRDFVAKDADVPLDVRRPVRLPAADLVVEDDGASGRQSFERRKVVVCRSGPAVQRQDRRYG